MQPYLLPWLTFQKPDLERIWQSSEGAKRRSADAGFFLLFGLIIGIRAVKAVQVKERLFDRVLLPLVVIEFLFASILIRWKPVLYSEHRSLIIAVQKTFHFFAICHLVMIEQEPVDTWTHFLFYELVYYGKSMFMIVNGLLLPLNFRSHLFVQSLQIVISMLYNPIMCKAFIKRMPANVERYNMVNKFLNATFNPSAWFGAEDFSSTANREGICLRAQVFLQTVNGFVLTGTVLFIMESHSKSVFYAQQHHQPCKRFAHYWKRFLMSACLLYLGLAFLWQWVTWIFVGRLEQNECAFLPTTDASESLYS